MSDTIRESSPLISPDTLRKVNQVNGAFYDTHTKKNFGRTDVLGSQYSGTVVNFGFEMLLEARKLKMEKPSLKGVFGVNHYDYYFDLQYSNMIETYEQQGMLEAVLKKDVFLSNKEYRLRFEDCEDIFVPRSEGWGTLRYNEPPKVFKDKFIHTTTPPTLIIKDIETEAVEEISLALQVADGFDADYYFYNEMSTQRLIDTYEDGTLLTTPITNEDAGLPLVWICEEIFKSLPPVNFVGNTRIEGLPILTIGVDGHDVSHIYPLIYGQGSLPEQQVEGTWYLRAYSELDGFIPNGPSNNASKISSIVCIFRPTETAPPVECPITFEEDYIKITLSDKVEWSFNRDDLNSPYYAEVEMEQFFDNGSEDSRTVLLEAFNIGFSDNYLFIPYEGLCEEAKSGVHIDILSDYSENSVPKKNGTIHSLGDYDGLPSYFKVMHDGPIHRSHVELYAIRDRLNRYTQKTMDKQTAGIILDTAMPQKELHELLDDQEPAIVYQYDPDKYLFVTLEDKVISKKNVLTEITFNNENEFGNCNIPKDAKRPKFVYHGNRTLSLSSMEFDPELETARVYSVTNDPASYENNALVEDKKAPRTLARICDIPTSYEQLMHIPNVAATYLFDKKYVRMGANFYNEDMSRLLNREGIVVPVINDTWLFANSYSLPTKNELVDAGYVRTVNIFDTNIGIDSTNFNISTGGSDYEVGDKFYVLVGGKAYDGEVTVVSSGVVSEISMDIADDATVSVYNVEGTHTLLSTTTTESENGTGLRIELEMSQSDIDDHTPSEDDTFAPNNIVSFAFDMFGNIFMYELQSDWTWESICQVSGIAIVDNLYDRNQTQTKRTFDYCFFKFVLDNIYRADESIFFNQNANIEESVYTDYPEAQGHKGSTDQDDLSRYIIGQNNPNTYYRLILTSDDDGGHFDLKTSGLKSLDGYEAMLPQFNRNNTLDYYNPANRFIVSNSTTLNNIQPSMFVYSPLHDKMFDPTACEISSDRVLAKITHSTTIKDYGTDFVDSAGRLKWNVYYYPEYEFTEDYKLLKNTLSTYQRSELITYIREHFGSNAEPFVYEDTEYRYTSEMLIEYIMARYPFDAPYVKDGLKVYGCKGDKVTNNGEYVGKPTTGAVVPLTAEVVETSVTVDDRQQDSELVNIFIIDDELFEGFDQTFRVFDINDNDITSTAIIIWRGDKYIFRNDEWIKLQKAVVDGYYNTIDRMFYKDAQYTDQIIPDTDIIYHDITTGQYYKWNGSNYVLISI